MIKWLLPAALLALSGCGKSGNLDGFKDLKFELGKDAVEQLGFTCPSDGACASSNSANPLDAQYRPADLRTGDLARGEAVFAKCASCHTIDQGGASGIGPNLYAIAGAPIATRRGGFAFSDALKAKGGVWTLEALDEWLQRPASFAPGTKMTFPGIPDPRNRANLIAYINSQGSNLPLPASVSPTPRRTVSSLPSQQPSTFTLFGKSAKVTPTLKAGKVVSIDVTVALGQKETIDLLTGEYGSPKSYEYDNFSGGRSRVTYWLFSNGVSISVFELLSEGVRGTSAILRREGLDFSEYLRSHTTVRYFGKAETERLLKQGSGNMVDPHDT